MLRLSAHLEKESAHQAYRERLQSRRNTAERAARVYQRLAHIRVLVFLLVVALAWFAYAGWISWGWVAAPVALFLLLVWRHDRVQGRRVRAERGASLYERGLERIDDRWSGTGQPGDRYLDPSHLNAADLDLFGRGSLFELLCTARTRKGEDTLADWLRAPALPQVIRARQEAVTDLRDRLDLREDLFLLAADVPPGVDLDGLANWGAAPKVGLPRTARIIAALLSALALVSVVCWSIEICGPSPFLLVLAAEGLLLWWMHRPIDRVIGPVEHRGADLVLLRGFLSRLETVDFTSPSLCGIQAELRSEGRPPSQWIFRLRRLIDWLEAQHNLAFAPIAFVLLWKVHFAFAIERWRQSAGSAITRWLAAIGEFEALSALACYAYEHRADPFPEILSDDACFDGRGLGHPLIPEARCVRNDVGLCGSLRMILISGSNMSGKSTLLRTVGINVVMALAGAPVRAESLRLSPVVVGATLRIQDSLQAGRSRFFAEITRLHALLERAREEPPLLFLLDELMHGTHSHDRRLGTEAVVRTLIDRGAIGLVTTHDLALAEIADLLTPRAANMHFEDRFENGTLTFDYRIRPGVVTKSNAVALMRSIGIQV
jgi:hypothetical protein